MGRCVEPNSTADEGLELDEGEPNTNNPPPPPPPPPSPPPDSTENDKEQADGDEVELRDEVERQRERVEPLLPQYEQLRALDGYYYREFRDLGTRMAPVTQFEVQESARAFLMKTSAVEMDRSCTCAW